MKSQIKLHSRGNPAQSCFIPAGVPRHLFSSPREPGNISFHPRGISAGSAGIPRSLPRTGLYCITPSADNQVGRIASVKVILRQVKRTIFQFCIIVWTLASYVSRTVNRSVRCQGVINSCFQHHNDGGMTNPLSNYAADVCTLTKSFDIRSQDTMDICSDRFDYLKLS